MQTIKNKALFWIGKRLIGVLVPVVFEHLRKQKLERNSTPVCGHCGFTKPSCHCKKERT